MDALWNSLGGIALLFVVFLPLERLFAAHRQRVFRRGWGTDLCFCLGQYFVWTAPVVLVLRFVHVRLDALPAADVREAVGALPLWVQLGIVLLACDVSIYWAHRWSHSVPFLWRFHRVHHTAERLDWIAAYREHPLDNLYTRLVENLPAMLLGLPLEALAGVAMFRGLWAIYIHSNTALDPGPLRSLVGAPRLHHWHHEVERGGRVNFANLSPLMDVVFGTYHDPGRMPDRYGIAEEAPRGYVAQLVGPFLPEGFVRGRLGGRTAPAPLVAEASEAVARPTPGARA